MFSFCTKSARDFVFVFFLQCDAPVRNQFENHAAGPVVVVVVVIIGPLDGDKGGRRDGFGENVPRLNNINYGNHRLPVSHSNFSLVCKYQPVNPCARNGSRCVPVYTGHGKIFWFPCPVREPFYYYYFFLLFQIRRWFFFFYTRYSSSSLTGARVYRSFVFSHARARFENDYNNISKRFIFIFLLSIFPMRVRFLQM